MKDLIPPRFRNEPLADSSMRLGAYSQPTPVDSFIIALCMAVLYAIGFAALGVPAWAGIATLAGLLNAIPYVGDVPGSRTRYRFYAGRRKRALAYRRHCRRHLVVQIIESYILTPRILGRPLSLPSDGCFSVLSGASSLVYSASSSQCLPLPSPKFS